MPGCDHGRVSDTDPRPVVDPLAPLRERYAHWLGMDAEAVLSDREEAAADVRALQLVLRLERDRPPSWRRAVELAATATIDLCLDPRATDPDGPWHEALVAYCSGHIRKVTRRARASAWQAVQDLPGVTLTDGDTQVRALVPGRIAEVDKRVSKLQVGGTDATYDPPPDRTAPEPASPDPTSPEQTSSDRTSSEPVEGPTLQMWFPPTPPMTLGKAMAQAGHAAMLAAALLQGDPATAAELTAWGAAGHPSRGERVDQRRWDEWAEQLNDPRAAWQQHRLVAVRDAGFTEIDPGTITVIARLTS